MRTRGCRGASLISPRLWSNSSRSELSRDVETCCPEGLPWPYHTYRTKNKVGNIIRTSNYEKTESSAFIFGIS